MKLKRALKWFAGVTGVGIAVVAVVAAIGFPVTSHPVVDADLGKASSTAELDAVIDKPGVMSVETVVATDWEVPLAGLVNLDHPEAKKAGLHDGPEPIQIFFHAVRHPSHGLYIVDTGVERAFADDPEHALLSGIVGKAMNVDRLKVENHLAGWLEHQKEPLRGVFMTHLHLDHLTGMRDVPNDTPVFAGPGETSTRHWQNLVVKPVTDEALAGKGPIRLWSFQGDPTGRFAGVLDVFGDGMFWALLVPGHTAGGTAYVARTPDGPVLLTGDTCHTAWGWNHGVEPGTFTRDQPRNAESLKALRDLVAAHPNVDVRLGHQSLKNARATL